MCNPVAKGRADTLATQPPVCGQRAFTPAPAPDGSANAVSRGCSPAIVHLESAVGWQARAPALQVVPIRVAAVSVDVLEFMAKEGGEPVGSTPEELTAMFKREIAKYAKVIEAGRIAVQ